MIALQIYGLGAAATAIGVLVMDRVSKRRSFASDVLRIGALWPLLLVLVPGHLMDLLENGDLR